MFWEGEESFGNRLPEDAQEWTDRKVWELIDHVKMHCEVHRSSDAICEINTLTDEDWENEVLVKRDLWENWINRVRSGIMLLYRRAPRQSFKLQQEFLMGVANVQAALDILLQEVRRRKRGYNTLVRGADESWMALRPIKKGKKEDTEELDLKLCIIHKIMLQAKQSQWRLHNGILVEAVPGVPCAVQPVVKKMTESGAAVPQPLEEAAWQYAIRYADDPEVYVEAMKNLPAVSAAASYFLMKNTPELPHIIPTMGYITFRSPRDGVIRVLQTKDRKGTCLRIGGMEDMEEGAVSRVFLPQHLDPNWLNLPMSPQFPTVGGPRLLEWMRAEPTETAMAEFKNFTASDGANVGYLAHHTSVIFDMLNTHAFSPQEMFMLFAVLGRALYSNQEMDKDQFGVHIHGPSRCGKSLLIGMLEQALGCDAIGTVNATDFNRFSLAGCTSWGVLVIQELTDKHNLPKDLILTIVRGEAIAVEAKGQPAFRLPTCHFHLVMTGNCALPMNEARNEISNTIMSFEMNETFAGHEDTTMAERRNEQIGALIIMCLRCYQALNRALGSASFFSCLPFRMRQRREHEKFERDYVWLFMHSGACSVTTDIAVELRRERFKERDVQRVAQHETLAKMGQAFKFWLRDTFTRAVGAKWTPDRYRPVFDRLNLPYSTLGIEENGFSTHPTPEGAFDVIPSGYVFFVQVHPDYVKRVDAAQPKERN